MKTQTNKEKNEKTTRRAERKRIRKAPERTAAVRDANSTILDGDRSVK